jgi:cytochrome c oxidase cbb3-type subunit 3
MSKRERDEISGVETTGHVWDGIRELNTPLPRWWVWTFYVTIIWALGYSIAYPAWPLLTKNTEGLLGTTNRSEVAKAIADAKAGQAKWLDQIAAADVEAVAGNDELRQFATAAGAAAFKVNCVQCHGSGAAGGAGYPNLNDDDWIWGGKLTDIYTTLQNGARYADNPNTRISDMPAFGDGILDAPAIGNVAEYVLKLSGQEHDEAAATAGMQPYADNCAACHGDAGQGNPELGAPKLADAIWLYGSDRASIVAQITKPHMGVMPAWSHRLDDTTIKSLAVYVHGLGGGQQATP